jgi:uncharacterized membrane protein YfcA
MNTLDQLTLSQWILGVMAAVFVGLGKGGLPGAGNLAIVFMAAAFGAKPSVGLLLPVLICADVVAVKLYHAHTRWAFLLKLLPWSLLGVFVGALLFDAVSAMVLSRCIGALLVFMVGLRFLNKHLKTSLQTHDQKPRFWLFSSSGIIGGIATIMANAAGPVVSIYLLLSGLPKTAYIGTAAWFFLILNLLKMPVQASLGTIDMETLKISLILGTAAAAAVLIAKQIVKKISQKLFEQLIWAFIIVAGLKMMLSPN